MNIPAVKLKNTELEVSRFCFGTMTFGKPLDQSGATQLVNRCIEAGINFFDTANVYQLGVAETMLGHAIKGKRHQLVIASKVFFKVGEEADQQGLSRKAILRNIDESLKRLGTDHLDLYLLHWESSYPIAESMRAMEKLMDDGRTRFAGVSNFDLDQLKAAQAALRHHRLAANQVLYHLGERGIERKLIPYCQQQEIAVVGYSPFGHGAFPRPDSPGGKVLRAVAERHGRTVRQVILNFLTRLPQLFATPKAGDPDHTRENAGGAGWSLT